MTKIYEACQLMRVIDIIPAEDCCSLGFVLLKPNLYPQ